MAQAVVAGATSTTLARAHPVRRAKVTPVVTAQRTASVTALAVAVVAQAGPVQLACHRQQVARAALVQQSLATHTREAVAVVVEPLAGPLPRAEALDHLARPPQGPPTRAAVVVAGDQVTTVLLAARASSLFATRSRETLWPTLHN